MFKLLRYFSFTSLAAFLVVTVLLNIFYRQIAIRDLIKLGESKNIVLAKALANGLGPEFLPYLDVSANSDMEALQHDPAIRQLYESVLAQTHGLSVVKIKVYNLDGITIFSTETNQIGENGSSNVGFLSAKNGQVASELTHRDSFSAFEQVIEDQDLLSTYIPMHVGDSTDTAQGVFEIYSNVTPLLERIAQTQRTIVLGAVVILAALYITLFFIVQHGDRIIRQQHERQLAAELELRHKQRSIVILQERERLARDLHDSIAQVLGYVNTQTQAARTHLAKEQGDTADTLLARLVEVSKQTQQEVRAYIRDLQTGISHDHDLQTALTECIKQFRHRHGIKTFLSILADVSNISFATETSTQIVRIVQEALNNIQKHAKAQHVQISVAVDDRQLKITVKDDGQGLGRELTIQQEGHHLGLQIMQDRAREIGGKVEIQSTSGHGVTVLIYVPIDQKGKESEPYENTPRRRPHSLLGRVAKPANCTGSTNRWPSTRWFQRTGTNTPSETGYRSNGHPNAAL